jgi:hypothetical protein
MCDTDILLYMFFINASCEIIWKRKNYHQTHTHTELHIYENSNRIHLFKY